MKPIKGWMVFKGNKLVEVISIIGTRRAILYKTKKDALSYYLESARRVTIIVDERGKGEKKKKGRQ